MTTQEVVQRTPAQELVARVRGEEFQSQLALALPEGVRQERFVRAVATALLDNPDLADSEKVEPGSVFQSLLKSAQDGLVPDGREAALVVFGRKAQYLPMIGGFRKIAAESGWTIRTAVVHDNDVFEVELGVEPMVRHVPVRPGADPGDPIAAYAVGAHGDGRREVEIMTVDEIEQVRAVSRAKDRGPWVDWWSRMAEKTVGRRLFSKLPLGDRERIERVLEAARMEPADAAAALYGASARAALEPGETVDTSTGEITPAAEPLPSANGPEDDGGRPAVPSGSQQAEAAASSGDEPSSPPAASAPDPDPEPGEEIAPAPVVPGGTHAGKTIVEIAAMGEQGGRWLSWATRHPESPNVGAEFHAALMAYFEARTEPADAAAALYGPNARAALEPGETLDIATGEITPAVEPIAPANGPEDDGGRPAVPSGSQQAEGAAPPPDADSARIPPASSAPDDDPEPTTAPTVPGGTHAGKTIAAISAMGEQGGRWLSWAMRHPESPNVGAEFHAALMAYFEAA